MVLNHNGVYHIHHNHQIEHNEDLTFYGILCNVFWSDDPEEAKHFLDMGIDTILTNDYNLVAQVLEK